MLDKMETVARKIIFEAGELVQQHIGQVAAPWVHAKAPSDYVTEIDKRCESLITEAIRENFPDHHIMAEETANEGLQPGYTWVIDPVDGTTNFIHGFPFVAVSIAVCLDKKPVLGLVLDPVRNELFFGKKGGRGLAERIETSKPRKGESRSGADCDRVSVQGQTTPG